MRDVSRGGLFVLVRASAEALANGSRYWLDFQQGDLDLEWYLHGQGWNAECLECKHMCVPVTVPGELCIVHSLVWDTVAMGDCQRKTRGGACQFERCQNIYVRV